MKRLNNAANAVYEDPASVAKKLQFWPRQPTAHFKGSHRTRFRQGDPHDLRIAISHAWGKEESSFALVRSAAVAPRNDERRPLGGADGVRVVVLAIAGSAYQVTYASTPKVVKRRVSGWKS